MIDNIKEYDRMIAGNFYNPDDEELKSIHMEVMTLCQKFNAIPFDQEDEKNAAKENLIPSSIGKNLTIFTPFLCEYGTNISVEENVFINYNCTFLDVAKITIGQGTMFGPNVCLATSQHPILAEECMSKDYPDGYHNLEYAKAITIGDNCWIGANVTILGGVTIGNGAIVAAGSVVTRDVSANSIFAGIPAKFIRKIDEKDCMHVWEAYKANSSPKSDMDS